MHASSYIAGSLTVCFRNRILMRNQAGKAHYVGTDYNKRGQQSSLFYVSSQQCNFDYTSYLI